MDEITLSSHEFKALSSDTRVQIIKLLNERNYTLTELSHKLNLASPTIKQHLDLLSQSSLIEQHDEGRKWKYYSLTRKGKKLLKPEETNVMILLSVSSIALIAVLILFIGFMGNYSIFSLSAYSGAMANAPATEKQLTTPITAGTTNAENQAPTGTAADTTGTTQETVRTVYQPVSIDLNTAMIYVLLIVVFAVLAGFAAGKAVNQRKKHNF